MQTHCRRMNSDMANSKNTRSSGKSSAASKSAKTKSNSGTKSTVQRQSANRQRTAVLLAGCSIFLACVVLIEGANVWTFLHNAILGLFGYCAYILPLVLLWLAVVFARNKPMSSASGNLIGFSALILLIGSAIYVFSNTEDYLSDTGLWLQITTAWDGKAESLSGGIIGAFFGGMIAKLFGRTGAQITILIVSVVLLMLLTGTNLYNLYQVLKKPVEKVSELKEAKRERRAVYEEEAETEELPRKGGKKAFNPPKVIESATDAPAEPGAGDTDEFVPIVPVVPAEEPEEELKVDIEIPNLKDTPPKSGKTATAEKKKPEPSQKTEEAKPADAVETAQEDIEEQRPAYRLPPTDCLSHSREGVGVVTDEELRQNGAKLIETLASFGVKAKILMINRGPSVTRYELQPEPGVRINAITKLSDDIALRLAASSVRIEAPIPNKSAIGVEVPNKSRASVPIRDIIDTVQFRTAKSKLNVAIGKDITGNVVCADLVRMPHLLIAGTTGSGKSVCLNSMIISLLFNATPDEVRLLLIDPKAVELAPYNGIAHLEVPVVSDPRKAAGALSWAVTEMQNRYKLFTEHNARDIDSYNKIADKTDSMKRLHKIVIFIDELNDLMMIAPNEVEDSICRLAQMARAAGMHLVVATQRPSVDVITGIIKANIPSRIALSVSSQVDSRTIIDMAGAEKLLGNGDMLFNPVGISKPVRVQGCYISEKEIESTVRFIKEQSQSSYDDEIIKEIEKHAVATKKKGAAAQDDDGGERSDELLPKAIEIVVDQQMASTTLLQRKLKLGYARAANIIDALEEKGIVGPFEGSKPRKVLVSKQQWLERQAMTSDDDDETDDEYDGE